jgi:ketosteroid isomerase-like protein
MSTVSLMAVTALLVGVITGPVSRNGREAARDAEQAVRDASNQEVKAFLGDDVQTLAQLWSDDLVVTNPLNNLVDKEAVLAMMKSGFLKITSYDRRIEYARAYGDVVIVAGSERVVWGGRMPNAGHPEQLRFTAVWKKRADGWQQVARHANIIRP